jgi:tetratricopeptide (TPR) repeat protein
LSKETTIAFVALGPLMLYFFRLGDRKIWTNAFIAMLIPGIIYTLLRFLVIGSVEEASGSELMNDPFLNSTESERLATIFLILAAYVKLLFIPFPLTHDYYPYHLPFLEDAQHYASWADAGTITGILVLVGLLFIAIKGLKSRNLYSFLALFFLGTSILISNLFFPIGVFMNERFMYVPSLAWAILLAFVVLEELPKRNWKKEYAVGFLGIVAVLFSGWTFARNPAWENDYSLALTDVKVSTGSAKANMSAGDALIREIEDLDGQEKTDAINEAFAYLKKSLEIYPEYFPPLDLLGKLYFESGNYSESIKFYGYCADRKPGNMQFVENIFFVGNKLALESRFEEAIRAFDVALAYSPREKKYLLAAAEVYAKNQQNPHSALPYMERAYEFYPNDPDVSEKMAITYAMLGRFQEAITILEPLLAQNPSNTSVMKNLGIAYYQMGQTEKGMALVNQSQSMESGSRPTP